MALRKFLVIYERRTLCEAVRPFRDGYPRNLSRIRKLPSGGITVAIVLAAVEAVLLPHESVRIFLEFLANRWMVLQISLEGRMVLRKFLVIYERSDLCEVARQFRGGCPGTYQNSPVLGA